MDLAALIDKNDRVIIVPLQEELAHQMHSIQCYGERFLKEFLILPSAPGEIELNPNWTWKFIIDPGLYDIDKNFDYIPMYKDQQH
jgi:hypothetical protein